MKPDLVVQWYNQFFFSPKVFSVTDPPACQLHGFKIQPKIVEINEFHYSNKKWLVSITSSIQVNDRRDNYQSRSQSVIRRWSPLMSN